MSTSERAEFSVKEPALSIFIDRHGSGPRTLVWLHSEWGAFDDPPVDEAVLAGTQVLVLHLPGWGVSSGVESMATLGDVATACWAAIDHLMCDGVVLVGHGIGATVACEMAVQQPRRVEHLSMICPFGIWSDEIGGADIFGLTPGDLMPSMYRDPQGDCAREQFPRPSNDRERALLAVHRAVVLGAAARFIFPFPDTGLADRLYRLAPVEVSLLWGECDGVVPPKMADEWRRLIPHAVCVMVPDAGHMLPYETAALDRHVATVLGAVASVRVGDGYETATHPGP
jgi:pimeloyl-ACP methyl ester carboxylesterase